MDNNRNHITMKMEVKIQLLFTYRSFKNNKNNRRKFLTRISNDQNGVTFFIAQLFHLSNSLGFPYHSFTQAPKSIFYCCRKCS